MFPIDTSAPTPEEIPAPPGTSQRGRFSFAPRGLTVYPPSTVRVCPANELRCPACSSLLHRTEISAGFMFAVCEGRGTAQRTGERCNAHLFIAVSDFVPGTDTHAVVSVVSSQDKAAIRDLALKLRRSAPAHATASA